jgi:hypothetical protein
MSNPSSEIFVTSLDQVIIDLTEDQGLYKVKLIGMFHQRESAYGELTFFTRKIAFSQPPFALLTNDFELFTDPNTGEEVALKFRDLI